MDREIIGNGVSFSKQLSQHCIIDIDGQFPGLVRKLRTALRRETVNFSLFERETSYSDSLKSHYIFIDVINFEIICKSPSDSFTQFPGKS